LRVPLRIASAVSCLGLAAVLLIGGCVSAPSLGSTDDTLPAYGLITPQEAMTVLHTMQGQPDFVLLDIRTAPEVEAGHIFGAAALDFYSPTFLENLAELDRNVTYLIYCRTGNRTSQTMILMAELGFEKVFDLDGGIRAWADLGYPVSRGSLDAERACSMALP
jgi:phage shock protein E